MYVSTHLMGWMSEQSAVSVFRPPWTTSPSSMASTPQPQRSWCRPRTSVNHMTMDQQMCVFLSTIYRLITPRPLHRQASHPEESLLHSQVCLWISLLYHFEGPREAHPAVVVGSDQDSLPLSVTTHLTHWVHLQVLPECHL